METKQLIAGFGLATLGLTGTTVLADDGVAVPMTPPTSATVEVKPVTEQDLTTAKAELDQATAAVQAQEAVVAKDKAEKIRADEAVARAQSELTAAEQLNRDATPEDIKAAEGKVAEAETAMTTAQTAISSATQAKEQASQAVTAQQKVVLQATEELKAKADAVTSAQAEVNQAQAILDGANQANIIKAAEEAEKALKIAQEAVSQAEQALIAAQTADALRAQDISRAQATLTTAQTNQATAQRAADKASQTATQTEQALAIAQADFAKAEADKNSINTITLTPEYIRDLKEYTTIGRTGDRTAVEARLAAMAKNLTAANAYKANPNDDNVTAYPVNEVPTEILTEVSLFASDLINQVRRQVGAPVSTVVTPSSVAFADKVTDNVVTDNWNTWIRGHYNEGITNVAREYQLRFTDRVANFYENWSGLIHRGDTVTLSQLKAHAHFAILNFLFAEDEWEHANSIAGLRYAGTPTTEYFAVDLSKVDGYPGIHFLGIKDTYLSSKSTSFDTTEIPNPKSFEIILQAYNNAQTALTTAQMADQVAQADKLAKQKVLTTATSAVTSAQNALAAARAVPEQTVTAQKHLDQARANLTAAETANTKAQEDLRNVSADLQTKQINLRTAKANLAKQERERDQAQTTLTAQQSKLDQLTIALRTAETALSQAEVTARQKVADHQTAKDALDQLRQAPQVLANAKQNLQKATDQQTKAINQLVSDELILASLKAKQSEAEAHFTALNTRYQDQLEKAHQLKLKNEHDAIINRGHKPIPLVDRTGKLVSYTVASPAPKASDKLSPIAPDRTLPITGTSDSNLVFVTGFFLASLGLVSLRRKDN